MSLIDINFEQNQLHQVLKTSDSFILHENKKFEVLMSRW